MCRLACVSSVYTASADWRVRKRTTAWWCSAGGRQPWTRYARSLQAFSAVSVLPRYTILLFAATSAGAGAIRNDTALAFQYDDLLYDLRRPNGPQIVIAGQL